MLLILTGQAEGFGHLPALAAVVVGQAALMASSARTEQGIV